GLRPETMSPCYGLAEATLMVSASRPAERARIARFDRQSLNDRRPRTSEEADATEIVGCGAPNEAMQVAIVEPESAQPAGDGAIGEIWVRGESVADGYFASPDETAETFGARLGNGEGLWGSGPWLRTGDLGFLHEGELFVTGRLKDMIIAQGRNLYPQD